MGVARWLVFHPEAWDDLDAATQYYGEIDLGLPVQFFAELTRITDLIRQFPGSGRVTFRDIRRHSMRQFPYAVLYRVLGDTVWVMAVVHQLRDPKTIVKQVEERE